MKLYFILEVLFIEGKKKLSFSFITMYSMTERIK